MKTDAEVQSNEPIITHSSHKPVLRPNWGPKGRKKFFYAPPPYLRVWMSGPPLSEGLDTPLIWFTFDRLKGHESFLANDEAYK